MNGIKTFPLATLMEKSRGRFNLVLDAIHPSNRSEVRSIAVIQKQKHHYYRYHHVYHQLLVDWWQREVYKSPI